MNKKCCTRRFFGAIIESLLLGVMLIMIARLLFGEKEYITKAPSAQLEVKFWLDEFGVPHYGVKDGAVELIQSSELGIVTASAELTKGFSVQSVKNTFVDQVWSSASMMKVQRFVITCRRFMMSVMAIGYRKKERNL